MEILNYTGKSIGLTNEKGLPFKILPSVGNAHFDSLEYERMLSEDGIAIYEPKFGRISGLPRPDPNNEKMYIVNRDIAIRAKNSRFDLVFAEDPIQSEGAAFYKKLVNYV